MCPVDVKRDFALRVLFRACYGILVKPFRDLFFIRGSVPTMTCIAIFTRP